LYLLISLMISLTTRLAVWREFLAALGDLFAAKDYNRPPRMTTDSYTSAAVWT